MRNKLDAGGINGNGNGNGDGNGAAAAAVVGAAPRLVLNKKQLSRERSLEIILRTALKVMVKRGYRNTTIEQIADASGFTKGAVYHYFTSKEELLMSVLDLVEQDVITDELPQGAHGASARDQVVRFLHSQAMQALEHADSFLFLVTLAGDLSNLGEPVGHRVDAIFNRLGRVLERIVLAGQKAGELSSQISAVDLTRHYVSSFSGNVLVWHRSGRREEIGRSQVRALRLLVLGVLTPNPEPHPAAR
jgi:AcrR family transcriptional regulator